MRNYNKKTEKYVNPIKLAVLLAAITAISGCTTIKGWFVDEDAKAQAKQAEAPELVVPKKFINPKKSDEFTLPPGLAKAAHENAITSPTSVLVFLEKSWVNQDDPHPAKIMIEKPDLVDDLALLSKKEFNPMLNNMG